jgi:hypothetical protein
MQIILPLAISKSKDLVSTFRCQKIGTQKYMKLFRTTLTSYKRWVGFIKDYDGGTLMECYIHPGYPYLLTKEIVQHQREFILDQLLYSSRNSVENSATELFEGNKRLQNVSEAPGVSNCKKVYITLLFYYVIDSYFQVVGLHTISIAGQQTEIEI